MADGVVRSFKNDVPTNPTPTLAVPGVDWSPPQPVEGNHFYIQHGENLVITTYAGRYAYPKPLT